MIGNIIRRGAPNADEKGGIPDLTGKSQSGRVKRTIVEAQEAIYSYLLAIVNEWQPQDVLEEFKSLFVYHANSFSSEVFSSVYELIFSNNQKEFINTLKRCCYILINNWALNRRQEYITQLIQIFSDPALAQRTQSPTLKRLRAWIVIFVNSPDFQQLKLFAARYEVDQSQIPGMWKRRYTSFLLAPQYADLDNPIEQREAARIYSRQLRERFKFELAMYVTRSQAWSAKRTAQAQHSVGLANHPSQVAQPLPPQSESAVLQSEPANPTVLGDEALRLIKLILARRGQFSYANLSHIFIKQIRGMSFEQFKASLLQYLTFAIEDQFFVATLHQELTAKLATLYNHHNSDIVTDALLLRTANRVIEFLTTEENGEPSQLFIALVASGNPLPLVIVLLKLILVSRNSRLFLEAHVAKLIEHYGSLAENDCKWVIHFLEVLNITFAIYAENVEFNLIKIVENNPETSQNVSPEASGYRIFSLQRGARLGKPDPEAFTPEEIRMVEMDNLPESFH